MVESLSRAALVCGCDGLLLEAHYNPKESLCDAEETIDFETLDRILEFNEKIKTL